MTAPHEPTLTPAEANRILALSFTEEDRERMHTLAAKARQDTLTDEERVELRSYERIASLLGLLQSKARRALADQ